MTKQLRCRGALPRCVSCKRYACRRPRLYSRRVHEGQLFGRRRDAEVAARCPAEYYRRRSRVFHRRSLNAGAAASPWTNQCAYQHHHHVLSMYAARRSGPGSFDSKLGQSLDALVARRQRLCMQEVSPKGREGCRRLWLVDGLSRSQG